MCKLKLFQLIELLDSENYLLASVFYKGERITFLSYKEINYFYLSKVVKSWNLEKLDEEWQITIEVVDNE